MIKEFLEEVWIREFSNKNRTLLRNMPNKFISVPTKNAIDNTVFKATELMIEKEQVNRINFAEFLISNRDYEKLDGGFFKAHYFICMSVVIYIWWY